MDPLPDDIVIFLALDLDKSISYQVYEDGRIDYIVNITNKQPTGILKFFRKGMGTAFNCQPVLILTNSTAKEIPYPLIWLIVYGNYSQNPSHIDLDPDVTRPIVFATVQADTKNSNDRRVIIPMVSNGLMSWSGYSLPCGEYNVKIKITRRGTSIIKDYGKVKFPDDAIQSAS